MPKTPLRIALFMFSLLGAFSAFSQGQSFYLFHESGYKDMGLHLSKLTRPCKTRIEGGLVFGFAKAGPHYLSGMSSKTGFRVGLVEEIPIQTRSAILIGAELITTGVSFNSYYFAPGESFLYNGQLIYYHNLSITELHFPVEYKFNLTKVDIKNRSLYMTIGWQFRYFSYIDASVTNTNTGHLVWEGQNDVTAVYRVLAPHGSSIFEATIGYQRFAKKKKKRGWYMALEYDYGASWLHYSGNGEGSNDVLFKLNTLSFKLGLTR